MNRALKFAAFAALGPITGPLAYGCVGCLKARRWVMAGVYATAIVETWCGLGSALRFLLAYIGANA